MANLTVKAFVPHGQALRTSAEWQPVASLGLLASPPKPKLLDKERVSASTQNQVLSDLLFLYRHVLGRWVFPQESRWTNYRTGQQGRHHVDESIVQKAVVQSEEQRAKSLELTPTALRSLPAGVAGA